MDDSDLPGPSLCCVGSALVDSPHGLSVGEDVQGFDKRLILLVTDDHRNRSTMTRNDEFAAGSRHVLHEVTELVTQLSERDCAHRVPSTWPPLSLHRPTTVRYSVQNCKQGGLVSAH